MKAKLIRSLREKWILRNHDRSVEINVEVPSTIFEILIDKHLIEDPFYGNNEHTMQHIYNDEWEYEVNFDLEEHLLSYKHLILRFKGLDTFADIHLNGTSLGSTENMFRSYEYDITKLVKESNNRLKVVFESPVQKAKQFVEEYKKKLKNSHGIPGVPYLRKAQYSFGWDWGPKLPDIGIWKDVEIEAFDDLKIESHYVDMNFSYNKSHKHINDHEVYYSSNISHVELHVSTQLSNKIENKLINDLELRCTIKGPDGIEGETLFELSKPELKVKFNLEYPFVWWTHDLGKPNLYDLSISLYYKKKKVDSFKSRFGIREIKLIREQDKWGETFYFTLNRIPIFSKGANWVPIDSFLSRGKKKGLYEQNIENCLAANMNVIRVWGGGVYEDNKFYELCDENGILVWQDFPFACAIYPIHEDFFKNVILEVIDNVKRLRNHPSLAMWCGNNELEQLWNWLLNLSELRNPDEIEKYEKGYLTLFKEVIPDLLKKYDPRRPYWPSSALDQYDGTKVLSPDPNNPESGDSHYWRVWHGGASFKSYRKFDSRFMSEFGFESFPSIKTIESFCPEDQLYLDSPIMNNHQKNEGGNKKILRYMRKRFSIPREFEKQIILSQITQAEAIQYGVEYWRQNRNDFHCMGSLYWQLNDCWPVASWSSFDYYGRWKALHYFARRFYNHILPSVREHKESFELWIINDNPYHQSVNYYWKLYNSQGELLKEEIYELEISPCYSKCIEKVKLSEIKSNSERNNLILFYGIESQPLVKGMRLFDSPKRFDLKKPNIIWDFEKIIDDKEDLIVKIRIKSNSIVLYLFITSNKYDFIASNNFFSMEPDEEQEIILTDINLVKKDDSQYLNIRKEDFNILSLFELMENA